jgi:transcription antitermination factor NusG
MIYRFCETASTSWVAVVVRPRTEGRVQTGLAAAGLETFVPWHKVRRNWSDRIKALEQNLFPGYMFCRSTFAQRHLVMSQPGVERVVSFNRQAAIIPDAEIVALRRTVESGFPMLPWPFLRVGQRVRIERGVLEGIEGALARDSNTTRIVVSVDVLQRSVAIEVDRDMIRPIQLGVSHGKSLYSIRHMPTQPAGVQSRENRLLNR